MGPSGLSAVLLPLLAWEPNAFISLARHAHRLATDTVLTACLYQVARRTAIDVVRRETRRQLREQIATEMKAMHATTDDWSDIEPLLDDAMQALDETDRTAVLLRYFENKSLREVGAILGASENAAQKHLVRAVERLRDFFAQRGVTVGASGLVVVLSASAVQAAPVGMGLAISTAAALSGATAAIATATANTVTSLQAITMTTLQKALITATVTAVIGTGLYESVQVSSLRKKVESLQQSQTPWIEEVQQLRREHQEATDRLAQLASENAQLVHENARLKTGSGEVAGMRAELARLRQASELAQDPVVQSALASKARLDELKQRLTQMQEQQIPQLQLLTEEDWQDVAKHARLDTEVGFRRTLGQLRSQARGKAAGLMSVALTQYLQASGGDLPGDLAELKPYFKTPLDDAILQQYQLLHAGKLGDVPQGQWLISERAPLEDGFDTTFSVGYNMFGVVREGALEGALGRYYETNPGQEPTTLSQLKVP
ncbi:MAG: sigma-70 family RNA polymerase sigma factor [Verrucomicrobiales bacterium]|nr:sigma-70 family RNA polymerase sigma factor [Verrucomicrobiales bacterium]